MAVPLNEILKIEQGVLQIQENHTNTKIYLDKIILTATQVWWIIVRWKILCQSLLFLKAISYFSDNHFSPANDKIWKGLLQYCQ